MLIPVTHNGALWGELIRVWKMEKSWKVRPPYLAMLVKGVIFLSFPRAALALVSSTPLSFRKWDASGTGNKFSLFYACMLHTWLPLRKGYMYSKLIAKGASVAFREMAFHLSSGETSFTPFLDKPVGIHQRWHTSNKYHQRQSFSG